MPDNRQTVLITGCSAGGIGNALAREFALRGLRVFATARQAESISELRAFGIETLSLEVHKAESIAALKSEVERLAGGKLDYLVNNAGRNYTVPALEINADEAREVFDTNVIGVMSMCQAFAPLVIAARGKIVQIGSVAGVVPYVFGSVYNASKAALHQYSNTLRVELAPFGVKVITIVTGGVQSRIARTERTLAPDSYYEPIAEEYARRVLHSQAGAMPNEAYARSVVRQVMRQRPAFLVWEGNRSWLVWLLSLILPKWTMDYIFSSMFKLWKVRESREQRKVQ